MKNANFKIKEIIKIKLKLLFIIALISLSGGYVYADTADISGIYNLNIESSAVIVPQLADGTAVNASSVNINSETISAFYANAARLKFTYQNVTPGNQYMVTVQTSEGLPSEENVVYMNSVQAVSSDVEFNIYPSGMQTGIYYIYVSGNNDDLARIASFSYYSGRGGSDVIYGDVNSDNRINSLDARLILQYQVGSAALTENQQKAANVNGDSRINALDARLILQRQVGIIERFPVEEQAL